MTSGDGVECSDSSQSFDIDCIWGKFISSMIWEQRAAIARRWNMGGCEEVPSYQLPWSVGLLNRDPDAALDGPNHCILPFDDLAFGSGWDVVTASWLQEKSVREGMKGGREEGRRWKVSESADWEDRDDLIQRIGWLVSHSDMAIKISSVIVCLIIKRFKTQLPSISPASPQDEELSDRWYRRQSLNGILLDSKNSINTLWALWRTNRCLLVITD